MGYFCLENAERRFEGATPSTPIRILSSSTKAMRGVIRRYFNPVKVTLCRLMTSSSQTWESLAAAPPGTPAN